MEDTIYKEQFKKLKPAYSRLCKVVEDVLSKRLDEQKIKTSLITSRPKTIDSFIEKIHRKPYKDPFNEIIDLAGVRVVCLYEQDLKKVGDIIYKEFEALGDPVDKIEGLSFDRMGYLGVHYIVKLNKTYSGPHYEGLHGLKCEIQVRTILQDTWAIISHHLIYKNEASIPNEIKREINKVAALLEIAQDIFDDVFLVKRKSYITKMETVKDDANVFLQQPTNFETLKIYTEWKYPKLSVYDRIHPLLVRDLDIDRYKTLKDIHGVIEQAEPAVEAYRKERPDLFKYGTDFITKSLGFMDEEFRKKHPFAKVTRQAFEKFKHLIKI